MPSREWIQKWGPRGLEWSCVVLASLAFALTFGLNYPIDNQVVYFLEALRQNDPTTLSRDWYAAEVTHYHIAITQLIAPLLKLSPSGWVIALLHPLVMVVGCCAWYLVCRRLVRRVSLSLAAFFLLLCLMTLTKTLSVAVSYVYNEAFQPSTLGSLGLLLALPPFLARRWLLSGVMLGLSGLFHANFLALNVAAFGLAHLMLGGRLVDLVRRLALQLGPSAVALVVLVAPMLATVASEHGAEAQRILFKVRSPHHYVPAAFQRDLIPFAAWSTLGVVCCGLLPQRRAMALFQRWWLATALVVWGGTLLTSWEYIARVAQLFVWRVAPFVDLAGQSAFCLALASCVARPRLLRRLSLRDWIALCISLMALLSAYALRGNPDVTEALCVMILVGTTLGLVRWAAGRRSNWGPAQALAAVRRGTPALVAMASALVFGWYVQPGLTELEQRSSLLRPLPPHDQELFDWIAANTPKDARFLSPPSLRTFRYVTERAIVVDWKATPMLPDEVIEWFTRIKDVTGRPRFAAYNDLKGYHQMDVARLRRLDEKYDVDFVLVFKATQRRLLPLKPVFENARWAIFDVRA